MSDIQEEFPTPSAVSIQELQERLKTAEEKCQQAENKTHRQARIIEKLKVACKEEKKKRKEAEGIENELQRDLEGTVGELERVKEHVVATEKKLQEQDKTHKELGEQLKSVSDDFMKNQVEIVNPIMIRALLDAAREALVVKCAMGSWERFQEQYLTVDAVNQPYPDMIRHSHLSEFNLKQKSWEMICSTGRLRNQGNHSAHLVDDHRIWGAICSKSANRAALENIFSFVFPDFTPPAW